MRDSVVPAEVGPQLRLAYSDQSMGEWMVMATEPIHGPDGDLRVFRVARSWDARWLGTSYGDPGFEWSHAYR